MIDVAHETLLTKEEAATFCKVSVPTVERWIRKGVRGRRLEVAYIGGSMRTSIEAVARFSTHPEQLAIAPLVTSNGQAASARFRDLDSRRARKQGHHDGKSQP